MYKILATYHQQEKQSELHKICYLDRAIELCELEAINFVLTKEGEKYSKKLFHKKSSLPTGFSIVKKTNNFMGKYTIYQKEKDGYLLKGSVKKIVTFITFKVPTEEVEIRVSTMDEESKNRLSVLLSRLDEDTIMNLKSFEIFDLIESMDC